MKILKSNLIIIFGFISLIINIWLFSIIQNHNSGIILANLDQTTIKDFTVNEQKVFKNALIDQLHDNNQHFVTNSPQYLHIYKRRHIFYRRYRRFKTHL